MAWKINRVAINQYFCQIIKLFYVVSKLKLIIITQLLVLKFYIFSRTNLFSKANQIQ